MSFLSNTPAIMTGAGILLLMVAAVVITAVLAIAFRRVVPTNLVHIVQSRKKTVEYGRERPAGNSYYNWPSWIPVIGVTVTILPESNFQVPLSDYEAYDKARLPFVVDVVAFFRVENAALAAQRVPSFELLIVDLRAVLQGAVRRILATNSLQEILEARSELGVQFTTEVKDQIAQWGVVPIKTIEFMDLRDSSKGSVISNIMAKEQSRIDRESRAAVAENKRMAEQAEIDSKREIEMQAQLAAEKVGTRTAEKDKAVGLAKEASRQEVLKASAETATLDMAVKQIESVRQAEITKEVSVIQAEQEKAVQVLQANAQREVREVAAQAEKTELTLHAEGNLTAAEKEAEGIKATGEAKAGAEQAMLMAPVNSQIALAKEIGTNEGYQKYLVTIAQIDAGKAVGVEMAGALENADLKVIANTGDVQQGVASLGDLLTPAGGTKIGGMLAALSQTPEGKQVLDRMAPSLGAAVAGAAAASVVGAGK